MHRLFKKHSSDLGISQEAILIAFGQSPSLDDCLKDADTIDRCIELKDRAPKNWPLQIKINDKIFSLIDCFEKFSNLYFRNTYIRMALTQGQKVALKELFDKYGPELIDSLDSIRSLEELFCFHKYYLNDFCTEKAINKRLRLWAEIIFTYETIKDCKQNIGSHVGDSVNKMITVRGKSILKRVLGSDSSTLEEIQNVLSSGFCDNETHEKGLIKYQQLLSKELRIKDISFERCISIFYLAIQIGHTHPRAKIIAYRAVIMAYKKAKTIEHHRQILKCFDQMNLKSSISSNRLYKEISTSQDGLTVQSLDDANMTISTCIVIFTHSTKSTLIRDYIILRMFDVAKVSDDYLSIANFLSGMKDSKNINVHDRIEIALDMALYTIASYEDWKRVWWQDKDQHSPFAYKCLRRLKAFEETQKGVDTVPIVDGLFVILPLADNLFVIPKNDKITIER